MGEDGSLLVQLSQDGRHTPFFNSTSAGKPARAGEEEDENAVPIIVPVPQSSNAIAAVGGARSRPLLTQYCWPSLRNAPAHILLTVSPTPSSSPLSRVPGGVGQRYDSHRLFVGQRRP